MPGPRNNKKKALKKPATAVHTAPETPTNVPVDIFTCKDAYVAAADTFLRAVDQTKVLCMLWEMAYGLGDLKGLEEGKEKGLEEGWKLRLEEGRKLGLEEGRMLGLDEGRSLGLDEGRKLGIEEGKMYYIEGDLTRAFNRGTRQGRADKQIQWIEVGHCEEGACIQDSCTFVSVGIGPDVTSTTHTFVDIKIGPDIIAMPAVATTYTHKSAGTQMTNCYLLNHLRLLDSVGPRMLPQFPSSVCQHGHQPLAIFGPLVRVKNTFQYTTKTLPSISRHSKDTSTFLYFTNSEDLYTMATTPSTTAQSLSSVRY
jgi:hypothetical protein